MKNAKYRYYKARIDGGDGNPYRGISFSNRQLPMGLLDLLNEKMHEAIDKFNGKLEWKRTLVQFEHDGVKYEQYVLDGCKQPCLGCCFSQKKDGIGCQHPHYLDGTKGTCGYPYRFAPSAGSDRNALSWQDIRSIVEIADDDRLLQNCSDQNWSKERYYSEVLKCFKEGNK